MNALPATGLVSSLQWKETLDCPWDTSVGDTIAGHLKQSGIPVPADELFQTATWSIPTGTELQSPEWAAFSGCSSAPALRVDFANELTVVLLIGWSDVCGCETCCGEPSLRVVEVLHRV